MTMTREARAEREAQVRQAQELLFSGPETMSFAKALFFGQCLSEKLFPYPHPSAAEKAETDSLVNQVRAFCDEHLDPVEIDQTSTIPADVIAGLGKLGLLGMTVPKPYGGRGMSQTAFCRAMEEIGARCGGTSVFVNAHLSIGLRALVLFGTEEQKRRWLPALSRGEKLAAFALTEPNAGSDAAGIETRAELNPQGTHYILNGGKQWITNGSIAGVLTVMAKAPVPSNGRMEPRVTAFLVTPDLPGFQVTAAALDKCGIRGTTTSKLEFSDMPVPVENVAPPLEVPMAMLAVPLAAEPTVVVAPPDCVSIVLAPWIEIQPTWPVTFWLASVRLPPSVSVEPPRIDSSPITPAVVELASPSEPLTAFPIDPF